VQGERIPCNFALKLSEKVFGGSSSVLYQA
jgi:hypothetical protein